MSVEAVDPPAFQTPNHPTTPETGQMTSERQSRKQQPPDEVREMTVADWKAFYVAYMLMQQVGLHGESALRKFVVAVQEGPPNA